VAPFIAIVLSIGILTAFGIAAAVWGIDTRPSYGDDHAR
jgi:hypothetical protein